MKNVLLILTIAFFIFSNQLSAQNKALVFAKNYDQFAKVKGIDFAGFSGLTIESWIKLNSYYTPIFTGSFIVTKEAFKSGSSFRYGALLLVLSDCPTCPDPGTLAFGLNFNASGNLHQGLHSYTKVPLHEWVHVAATWDGDSMSVFINGIFDRSLDVSSLGAFYDPPSDTLHIGARELGTYPGDDFDGIIDEVRIWNIARTESEIRGSMHEELTGIESGLYAYYKLNNEGTGSLANQKIVDSGPNGFDGTLGIDSTNTTNDPSWGISTSPMPYYTVQDGDWDNDLTWASGQLAPENAWARAKINDAIDVVTNATIKDLYVNPTGELTIDASNTLTVDGDFSIFSDDSQTGSFIDHGAISYASATLERYLSQNQWHFIGIPVSTAQAGVFFIPGGSQVFLRTHIESTNGWGPWITNVTDNLELGRGYECWVDDNVNQDETIQFNGLLNTGDYTTGSGSFYDLEYTTGHGLNLISNPYPSALGANIGSWAKTNVANSVWVWDGIAGNYRYWNGTENPAGSGYGTLTGGIIPAMQGFFIEATGANPSVTLPHSGRVHHSQNFYKDSGYPNQIRLDVSGNGYNDAIFVMSNQDATLGFDAVYDVKKIYGLDEAPQLFIYAEPDELSVNALPELASNSTIEVGFKCSVEGQFEIDVTELGAFPEGTSIYLEDNVNGSISKLNEGFVYSFEHSVIYPESRFKLHFTNNTGVDELSANAIRVWSDMKKIYVSHDLNRQGDAKVFDLQGRNMFSTRLHDESLSSFQLNVKPGIYIVEVSVENEIVRKKVYLK